jgi:hypothetical protein
MFVYKWANLDIIPPARAEHFKPIYANIPTLGALDASEALRRNAYYFSGNPRSIGVALDARYHVFRVSLTTLRPLFRCVEILLPAG